MVGVGVTSICAWITRNIYLGVSFLSGQLELSLGGWLAIHIESIVYVPIALHCICTCMLAAYMQGSLVMLGGFGWIYTASTLSDGPEQTEEQKVLR